MHSSSLTVIAEQLKKRMGFRRVLKMRAENVMNAGAQGVKIQVSGRLGGAEMSRRLDVRLGFAPALNASSGTLTTASLRVTPRTEFWASRSGSTRVSTRLS